MGLIVMTLLIVGSGGYNCPCFHGGVSSWLFGGAVRHLGGVAK